MRVNHVTLIGLSVFALICGWQAWTHHKAGSSASEIYTEMYYVQPAFLTSEEDTDELFPPVPKDQRPLKLRLEEDAGILFPEESWVSNSRLSFSGLLLRNTAANHEKLVRYLDLTYPGKWRSYKGR